MGYPGRSEGEGAGEVQGDPVVRAVGRRQHARVYVIGVGERA